MAFIFNGDIRIPFVPQPEGTEQCFPALITAALGKTAADLEAVNASLIDAHISRADGSTEAFYVPTTFAVEDKVVTIDPLFGPSEQPEELDDTPKVIDRIIERLATSRVLLLHKKNHRPSDTQLHWLMIIGVNLDGSVPTSYMLHDPLKSRFTMPSAEFLTSLVQRSLNREEGGQGIYPSGLSVADRAE